MTNNMAVLILFNLDKNTTALNNMNVDVFYSQDIYCENKKADSRK